MGKANETLWEYRRHTAAKHAILTRYLDAWIPILGSRKVDEKNLVLIDAFAGPGRYKGNEKGSPLLMLDAYLRRADRQTLVPDLHYFFIEEDAARYSYLADEVDRVTKGPRVHATCLHGSFEDEFPRLIDELRARFGSLPPTFAFIDPFGADKTRPELTSPLLRLPRCEALIYVPITHLARFVREADMDSTLTNLFAGRSWEVAKNYDDLPTRKRVLHDLFADQLRATCSWVRSFEIVPDVGKNSYYLFFGTNNLLGLRKMKAAMWSIDTIQGQSFRDSTTVDHPVLFQTEPDYERLLAMLRSRFGCAQFRIEDAMDFTLKETPFRDDAHLKRKTLAPAEREGLIEVVRPLGARRSGYVNGTRLRFASEKSE